MPSERIVPVLVRRLRGNDLDEGAAATDVMYDNHGKAHHRTRCDGVQSHDLAHTLDEATFPQLSIRAGDQILWIGDDDLEVLRIEYIGPRIDGKHPGHHAVGAGVGGGHHAAAGAAHDTPSFSSSLSSPSAPQSPFRAMNRPCADGAMHARVVASGPPDAFAEVGFYKATFRVGNREVDPDFEITP